tara:strand:- start:428 stop:1012 length:585 start_codon:yes stop_codon:yes gene_type:complete
MKKVFFIFLLSFTFSNIIAQNLKMGLFLSPSINSINTNDFSSDKKKIGFNYGYLIEYSFTENHSIESGFEISKKSGEIDNINYKSHYLTFPAYVKMKSRQFGYFTYFAKTGPSIAIKLRDNVESNINQNFGDAKNLMILMNVALGTEYSLKQETSLIAELYIKNGITHGWKDTGDRSYETFLFNQFGISLGFLF